MHFTAIDFIETAPGQAQCVLLTPNGAVSLQCHSNLSSDATAEHHRAAWLHDAQRQLTRMPEFRNTTSAEAIKNALLSAAVTSEGQVQAA